jgi:hypothetical protein
LEGARVEREEAMEEQHVSHIEPSARIMLPGTFHSRDAGLDRYQLQHHVDVLSRATSKPASGSATRGATKTCTRVV